VKEVAKTQSPNYLFVTLTVSPEAKASKVALVFSLGKNKFTYSYELRNKFTAANRVQGFNLSDVMYLIMPDRFANANPAKEHVKSMPHPLVRDKPFGRQVSDIKGVSDHLAYILEIGVRTIWLNPVLENNQEHSDAVYPEDNIYVYFRYTDTETVMVVMN
jgi:hypothetical protein